MFVVWHLKTILYLDFELLLATLLHNGGFPSVVLSAWSFLFFYPCIFSMNLIWINNHDMQTDRPGLVEETSYFDKDHLIYRSINLIRIKLDLNILGHVKLE